MVIEPSGRLGVVKRSRTGAQHLSISELRNELLDGSSSPSLPSEQQQRRAGRDQLGVGKDAKDVVGAERRLRFLVGPAGATHVHEVAAYQHRRRNAGQKVVIDIALHGRVGRFEVVTAGGHFQVFHGRSPCRRCPARLYPYVVPAWCAVAHGRRDP
jgi:hypothetical protein